MTQEHDAETVEAMAAAMWRAETIESGTPKSVTMRRTPQMFRDLGEANREKWIKFARAALSAMQLRDVTAAPTHWMVSGNNMMVGCWGNEDVARAIAKEKPYYEVTPMRALAGDKT